MLLGRKRRKNNWSKCFWFRRHLIFVLRFFLELYSEFVLFSAEVMTTGGTLVLPCTRCSKSSRSSRGLRGLRDLCSTPMRLDPTRPLRPFTARRGCTAPELDRSRAKRPVKRVRQAACIKKATVIHSFVVVEVHADELERVFLMRDCF